MEFKEVIKSRYSCRQYADRAVEEEKLIQVLEAAQLAPTAKNLQEQHLYVIQSEEKLALVDEATRCRFGAPVVVLVAYDKNNVYTYPGEWKSSGDEDAAIVATHMVLAAKDAGLDTCWVNAADMAMLHKSLGLPEEEDILMLMDLGYAAEDAEPAPRHFSRKPLEETVTYL